MQALVFVAVLCLLPAAVRTTPLSYGQLAQKVVSGNFTTIMKYTPTLNSTTLPQDVNPLRKALLFARNLLDLFIFAYPTPATNTSEDVWQLIRSDLNVGYTVIGNFQDLNHSGVNYTIQELEERRNICLAWLNTFLENAAEFDYAVYVASPNLTSFYTRPTSDLTQFFWKNVNMTPSANISGLMNVAALTAALLRLFEARYKEVYDLAEVFSTEAHTTFHDYRKLSRAINWLAASFPVLLQGNYSALTAQGLNYTNTMYALFGNLNDEATAYAFYRQYGPPQLMAAKRVVVQQGWVQLKAWLQQGAFQQQIGLLEALIIQSDPTR